MTPRTRLAWLATSALLAVAACSEKKEPSVSLPPPSAAEPPPPAPPPPPVEKLTPCALFTPADAQELLGGPVDPAVSQEHGDGAILSCSYAEKEGPPPKGKKAKEVTPAVLTLTLQVAARTGTKTSAEVVDRMKKADAGLKTHTVDLADVQAIWVQGSDMMWADKNGWIIQTSTTKKGDRLGVSHALMEKIVPRLPPAPP